MQTNVAKVRRRGENLVHENLVLEFVADEVENDDDDEPEVARSGKRRRREDIPSPADESCENLVLELIADEVETTTTTTSRRSRSGKRRRRRETYRAPRTRAARTSRSTSSRTR